jgi:hypothetical protein
MRKRADLFNRLRDAVRLEDGKKESIQKINDVQAALSCADVHSAETIVSVCRVGLKVMDGGGFAASLNEFSEAWAIYFPDVVSSKSKKALTKM